MDMIQGTRGRISCIRRHWSSVSKGVAYGSAMTKNAVALMRYVGNEGFYTAKVDSESQLMLSTIGLVGYRTIRR